MTQSNPFRKQVFSILGERYSDRTLVLCPTVFVRLLGGDHKAAILLSQILYWSDKTKDPDGWFWKSYSEWTLETGLSEAQVRRIVNGDRRVTAPQITLRALGIETRIRKVRHTGAPTLHYRINQPQFMTALHAYLGQGDPQHCAGSIPANVQPEPLPLSEMDADESAGTQIASETTLKEESAEDFVSDQRDEDLAIFHAFQDRFGKLKAGQVGTFRNELIRLGADRIVLVLERCATRARSWNYVQKALANEITSEASAESLIDERYGGFQAFSDQAAPEAPDAPSESPTPVPVRLLAPCGNIDMTALEVWQAAYQQMELQFDRATFTTCMREAALVDFEPESQCFVVAVGNVPARDMLQYRLERTLQRILSDVAGQSVVIQAVVAGGLIGQEELIA